MKQTGLTSVVLAGALLVSACGHQAQYSSGNEYLARHVERMEKAPKVKGQTQMVGISSYNIVMCTGNNTYKRCQRSKIKD